MNFVREAIRMIQEGANPVKVAESLVVESSMSDFVITIQDTIARLEDKGSAQVSFGKNPDERVMYFLIKDTIFKITPKHPSFIAIGAERDINNVIQRDLESLLTLISDASLIDLDSSNPNVKSLASKGAEDSLKAVALRRSFTQAETLEVFKDLLSLSMKDVESLFGDDWATLES